MPRLFLIVLFGLGLLTPRVHAQHPADLLRARLGDTIDPDEQAHFGLFPSIPRTAFVAATYRPEGTSLRVELRTRGRDTSLVLNDALGTALGTYVDGYEKLFASGTPALLAEATTTLAFARLARPNLVATDRTVIVERADGTGLTGDLLYADAGGVALLPTGQPYVWRDAAQQLAWIPAAEIVRVRAVGGRQQVLTAGQLVGAAGLFAAQALAASGDGVTYRVEGVSLVGAVAGAAVVGLSAVTNTGPGRGAVPSGVAHLALFARTAPPEFRAWWAARDTPTTASIRPKTLYQPRLHVTLLDTWSAAGDVSTTQVAMFDRPSRPTQTETFSRDAYVPSRQQSLVLDAEVRVWKMLSIGGAYRWSREGAGLLREDNEQIADKKLMMGFMSAGLNGLVPLPDWLTVSVGVGAARFTAEGSGAVYATRAFQDKAPDEGNIERYAFRADTWLPAARFVVDLYGTRALSLVGRVVVVPGQEIEIAEVSKSGGLSNNRWSNTQAAHTLSLSPVSVGIGLRAHL